MKPASLKRRNRIWLFVAAGWLAFAGVLLLGAGGPRTDIVGVAADSAQGDGGGPSISDGWITTKIKATYAYSRWIDGSDIKVYTTDGMVKLSGSADSSAEKELAIELAQSIGGVREVDASGLEVG